MNIDININNLDRGGFQLKKILFYSAVLAAAAVILLRAEEVIQYSREAIDLCCEIIIPSLFPFFVVSGLLIYSGFASVTARLAEPFMRPLFNVSPAGACAFVMGIISGFPVGAVTASQLYRSGNLSKSEAERLLAFCNNSGPLFIIGTVGAAIYGKLSYGVMLYIIHITSSLIVGIAFRFYHRNKHTSPPTKVNTNQATLPEAFSAALRSSIENILTVCFSIIFFSAISRAVISMYPLSAAAEAFITGICEFSSGILKISLLDVSTAEKLLLTSFIVGFSGLCVHLQVIASVARSGLSMVPYIFGKLLHAVTALLLTGVFIAAAPPSLSVFSSVNGAMGASFTASALMVCIGCIAVCVLGCISTMRKWE